MIAVANESEMNKKREKNEQKMADEVFELWLTSAHQCTLRSVFG